MNVSGPFITNSNNNNNNSYNTIKNNNTKDVTITTINDHNRIPRVEKVVFDNRIKRKNVLALNEKVSAIREYEKRPVYKRIGRMFHCSPDQIKRIVQQKETILNAWEQRTRKCRDAKTLEMKVVKVSMLGKAVYEWIRRMMYYKDILITDGLIQKMALQFKSNMGLPYFFPSQEWCDKFRTTYNIPTCDSKLLDIAYTQGHSVQIKDVIKDVLSECSPDQEDDDDDDDEDGDDETDFIDDAGEQENGNCENNCINLDSDEGENKIKSKLKHKIKHNIVHKMPSNQVNPSSVQIIPSTQLQGIRQLVALPLPTNGLPGTTQKVLVATPIVAPGQKQGSTPMTMTIIPLASLTKPSNPLNSCTNSLAAAALSSNNNNYSKDQQVVVPSPMVEIKKEIKEEPIDEEESTATKILGEGGQVVEIKKEYLTDDEDVSEMPVKSPQIQIPPIQTNTTPVHIVAIPLANKDMTEESTNDSLDNLSLSSLRKRIKTEGSSEEQNTSAKNNNGPPPLASITVTSPISKAVEVPPMPPLTKAPIQRNSPSSTPSVTTTPVPSLTPLPPSNRSSHKRLRSNEDQPALPPIRSYAEGRKYLKLLEDFALERENFRLIGLITRADEVLRELDRKENNEDEDVEID